MFSSPPNVLSIFLSSPLQFIKSDSVDNIQPFYLSVKDLYFFLILIASITVLFLSNINMLFFLTTICFKYIWIWWKTCLYMVGVGFFVLYHVLCRKVVTYVSLGSWFHEILALIRMLSTGWEKKLHIGVEFQQFSRNNKYVRVPGKLLEITFKDPLFSKPGDKILTCVKTRGQIGPVLKQENGYCPLDWRTTRHSTLCMTVFQAPWHACCSWKTVGTPPKCIVFLQSKGLSHN